MNNLKTTDDNEMESAVQDFADGLDWEKGNGLLPAVIQHADKGAVLMLGYMNREALTETLRRSHVVFWSRTKQRLWEKGETSGNSLELVDIEADCDADTLLIQARPLGPVCHTGAARCFSDRPASEQAGFEFLDQLDALVAERRSASADTSYTASLFTAGIKRIAQKVGEEGVETVLAAVAGDRDELLEESADLLFHLSVLLRASDASLREAVEVLAQRHASRS